MSNVDIFQNIHGLNQTEKEKILRYMSSLLNFVY